MSIIRAYLRLVTRWRWTLLLALLIGTFLLEPLLTGTGFSELVSFTIFILVFGGAIYAGRTGPGAARAAVALLLLALVLRVLDFLGLPNLQGPLYEPEQTSSTIGTPNMRPPRRSSSCR